MPVSNSTCSYNSVSFSTDLTYYIHDCLGPDIPESVLRLTDTGEVLYPLEENARLRRTVEEKAMPEDLYLDVPLSSGYTAKVRMRVPSDMDATELHPLLVDVYAGPESQVNK